KNQLHFRDKIVEAINWNKILLKHISRTFARGRLKFSGIVTCLVVSPGDRVAIEVNRFEKVTANRFSQGPFRNHPPAKAVEAVRLAGGTQTIRNSQWIIGDRGSDGPHRRVVGRENVAVVKYGL